ncbi:Coenzyme PQQ synthesis protein B [Hyella patelloides LEGE 07179]|uniref:Coenzyme PQQ synthesis protein B n=1 Tax=Hyella patelloides LEGE 07179 TaxID=945734 RepID=A0A563W1R5_9CYAN|nr:pyrroloquinoline quinone biosynthesis protein PqqB [Hyella patelloides]VEP17642.1 Coenzyme PQQ synthesis protein B [Hyella patelloides LEGE 07179]
MLIRILGSAAGGGFPQWNCNCAGCQATRRGEKGVHQRTQSSLAVRGTLGDWFLVNASPDVRQQLERLRDGTPTSIRSSPIAGVLLSDGEIDHTAGLMILRESSKPLNIYGTDTVKQALTEGFSLLRVLKDYCGVEWSVIEPGSAVSLGSNGESSLEVEAFLLPGTPPKYMRSSSPAEGNWVVGFTFSDRVSGGVLTYAPALAEFTPAILERFESSDCILVDGTFWQNDELVKLGMSTRTALAMGHLPLSGADGSLSRLSQLSCSRKIFTHINNTNPILIDHSPERQKVEAAGIEVGYDGLTIEL